MTDDVELDIEGIEREGEGAIAGAHSTEVLSQVETEYLGKRSALTRTHRTLGGLDPEARKEAGRQLNEVRARLESRLAERRAELA
ncbi:MAG TPA: phenylalanine--tRNA ligase subunit alpha, partial [Acidimicrobiales bacterium]|nr:phenylalanine--tRNA ligase subunit alpha [Acidimicrobiales bacterium]